MEGNAHEGELQRKKLVVYTNRLQESGAIYTEGFDRKAGQHHEPFHILGNSECFS